MQMATVTFNITNNDTLTGTSADDVITVVDGNAGASDAVSIVGGSGTDEVVFDGVLGDTAGTSAVGVTGGNVILNDGATDDTVAVSGVETLTFDNGSVQVASVDPQLLLNSAITQSTAGSQSWDTENLISFTGLSTDASTDTDWSLQTVDGKALSGSNTVTLLNGTTVLGTLSLSTGNVVFTADNAFIGSLNVGDTADVSFDIVLVNSDDETFTQTVTAVVTGVQSEGDDIYVAAADADKALDLLGGDDRATGNAAADTIFGEDGNDTIFAGAADEANDLFLGGDDDDIVAGGAGNDTLVGDSHDGAADFGDVSTDVGSNTIFGGAGNDVIAIGGYNNDGTDFAAGAAITTATGDEGGEAYGGAGNDYILGTDSGHDLVGMGAGEDTVLLGTGNSTVYAGADDAEGDSVTVEAASTGNNEIYTGAGEDTVTGAGGDDTIGAGADDDTVSAGAGDDVVYAGAGDDSVLAGTGADEVYGGAGDDTIDADAGADTIYGGAGDDQVALGGGDTDADVFVFSAGNDSVTEFETGTDKIDVSALGIANLDDAVIVTDSTAHQTTIIFDEDTSITYDADYTINDFVFA
uniref:RB149 n=1 Tax=Ruegeria sp. PR1b TaxID=185588 RepID=Q8KW93_9RHOB|nr:calcium-binding protein [Ruegeria sp. PR1b]AAN05170.1 RB149 [Ruegeria sp. PR1b]